MNLKEDNNQADQPLVEQVLSGNTNAFRFVITKTEGLVTQIIFKMIANSEDRKDIVQDVYLKTFKNLGRFRFQSKLSTWVAQIAYNACINYLEKKKLVLVDPFINKGDGQETTLTTLNDNSFNFLSNETEKLMYQKEIAAILSIELTKLSPLYQTLITLYHKEELSYAEIVQITELPEGTVKNYLFRARKMLRDNILLTYKKEAL